jgi:hypothetical protein
MPDGVTNKRRSSEPATQLAQQGVDVIVLEARLPVSLFQTTTRTNA